MTDSQLVMRLEDDVAQAIAEGEAEEVLFDIIYGGVMKTLEMGEQVGMAGFVLTDEEIGIAMIPYDGDRDHRELDFRVFVDEMSYLNGHVVAVAVSAEGILMVGGDEPYVQDIWMVVMATDWGVGVHASNIEGSVGTPNRKLQPIDMKNAVLGESDLIHLVESVGKGFFGNE